MSVKSMLSAVERYLAVQQECETKDQSAAQRAVNANRLQTAKEEIEKEAGAGATHSSINRIVAAVDHERHPALEAALKIAEPLDAEIAIIFVLEPLPSPSLEAAYAMSPAYDQSRAEALALLKNISHEVPPHTSAFTLLKEGAAADEIVTAAKDFNADLIVIGTHRRGSLARFFLGSVSQSVVRKAHCPVMFVTDAVAVPAERETTLQAT